MFTIAKQFAFSASHRLNSLPEDHPCSRMHGHNYEIELELASEALDARGFVVDYRDLDFFKKFIDAKFDHRHLNDTMRENPTAENIARMFFKEVWARGLPVTAVRVRETPKTVAEYRP